MFKIVLKQVEYQPQSMRKHLSPMKFRHKHSVVAVVQLPADNSMTHSVQSRFSFFESMLLLHAVIKIELLAKVMRLQTVGGLTIT